MAEAIFICRPPAAVKPERKPFVLLTILRILAVWPEAPAKTPAMVVAEVEEALSIATGPAVPMPMRPVEVIRIRSLLNAEPPVAKIMGAELLLLSRINPPLVWYP